MNGRAIEMKQEPPVIELDPDPRLAGWPKPIGFGNPMFKINYDYTRKIGWKMIGLNCYQRRSFWRTG
jgi:hypothetical protein